MHTREGKVVFLKFIRNVFFGRDQNFCRIKTLNELNENLQAASNEEIFTHCAHYPLVVRRINERELKIWMSND